MRLTNEGYHGYNIVQYRRRFCALPAAQGAVDLRGMSDEDLQAFCLHHPGACLGDTPQEVLESVLLRIESHQDLP